MIRSFYSIRRRILQAFSLWCLLSVPLGYFCFDIDAEVVRAFGKEYGYATMFTPFFILMAVVIYIGVMSMKKGRIFCSHICPMQLCLELIKSKGKSTWLKRIGWGLVLSLLITQSLVAFFVPVSAQFSLLRSGSLMMSGVLGAILLLFLILFVVYKDTFCKKACPYNFMQLMLRSDRTRVMEFRNPDHTCTNCKKCDEVCPYDLQARFESHGLDCSNCNLCQDACTEELGAGNSLFHRHDPFIESET